MTDESPLHIAPLPDGHAPSRDCPCAPVRSSVSGREILIHRTGAGELPLEIPKEKE